MRCVTSWTGAWLSLKCTQNETRFPSAEEGRLSACTCSVRGGTDVRTCTLRLLGKVVNIVHNGSVHYATSGARSELSQILNSACECKHTNNGLYTYR